MRLHSWGGSLFSRLVLLVVIAVAASQIFTLWLVSSERQKLLSQQLYREVINTLADVEGALDGLPPESRAGFLAEYNRLGMMQLYPVQSSERIEFLPDMDATGELLRNQLSQALGEQVDAHVRLNGERRELWLKVGIIGDDYWLIIPRGRFRPRDTTTLWMASGLASLVAMMVAFAIAWRVTRPLSKLATAAESLQHGVTPAPLTPRGPKELAEFTQRFNSMVTALDDTARERRLMLAGLSHDLRTPLTRLKLGVELQPDNTEREGMLDDIDQLSRIVQQFVDFARSEETMQREPVQLAELADSVVARFRREGIDISLQVQAEPELLADALALERLLTNLIDNARRYGAQPIKVVVEQIDKQATLTVYDHGQGIPPAQREAVLAPFERLAPHRGADGGSGLGLAIVSRIVKQHHGQLIFLDTEDGGFGIRVQLSMANAE